MRRIGTFLAGCAILLAGMIAPVAAQQNTPTKLTTSINTVLVPVVVTDKQGNHVKGLTRDDFEIKEDGKAQQVLSFQEMIAESKPVERADSIPYTFTNKVISESPKNMQIIAMDLINTTFSNQAEARTGLLNFLEKSVSEDSLMALVVFYPNGVHLIHNFTSDRSVLADAIKKLQGRPTSRDVGLEGSEVDAEAAMIDAFINGANANGLITGNGNANAQIGLSRAAAGAAQIDAQIQAREGLMTLECMQQVAQYFSDVPGRKSLVWASSGFRFSANATGTTTGKGATAEEWQKTVRSLQDANIAVYPIDVSGLIGTTTAARAGQEFSKTVANNLATASSSGGDGGVAGRSMAMEGYEAGLTQDPIQAKHDTMRNVADWTGGQPFYNSNDLENLFRRAGQDSSQYYMLTYSTTDKGKDGWRKIEVKVRRDGVQVRSRSGFFFSKALRDPDASRQTDELLAVTSMLNFTSLPITVTWQNTEPGTPNRKVHFQIVLPPGATEIDAEHENHINLDFLAIANNQAGQEAGKITQRLDRKLPPAGVTQIQASGITYANTISLPPGQYKVHVAVRDNLTGKIGSVIAPLTVQ